ncbi:ganglioside GM2 activator-like [Physella acuta]|uniref:ganglioside GM2 activator-like n=1 Tax=Physella acuta TaxID=109671 RepID=UPI0027DB5E4F|nr:ganglioside GM2 activator-like [Physella acuta]XP_059149575.1 ganglioside GM2 activator-like [Physella acuta]
MKVLLLLLLTTAVSSVHILPFIGELELKAHNEIKTLVSFVTSDLKDKATEQLSELADTIKIQKKSSRLKSFSFKNCADPSTEILVPSGITVKPDPIKIPGNISIAGNLLIKTAFGSQLKTSIEVDKEVFGVWVKVPCIDNIGSCNYPDLCTMLSAITDCPPEFKKIGLPCKCPFPAGNFAISPFGIPITGSLPFPISGGVRVKISATYNNNLLSCAQLELDLA